MYPDIIQFEEFYATPLGTWAQQAMRLQAVKLWPTLAEREKTLLLGYGLPLLPAWPKTQAIWAMPAAMGGYAWPSGEENRAVLVQENHLPFDDATFERIVVLHGLEFTENPTSFLGEIGRVLTPNGQAIIAVPHRMSWWSRREISPFAQGYPYSVGQLKNLVQHHGNLQWEQHTYALQAPPLQHPAMREGVQKILGTVMPHMGGLLMVQFKKRVHGGTAVRVMPSLKAAQVNLSGA